MRLCVLDTERIKGSNIYLLAYQIYDDKYDLLESKTFQDISISLDTRKSPKRKTKELEPKTIKISSFVELYENIKSIFLESELIVFSKTDINVIRNNCKVYGIDFIKPVVVDLQEALLHISTNNKSNLRDFCKKNNIKYNAHIPEEDCKATFEVYKKLIQDYGNDFLIQFKCKY